MRYAQQYFGKRPQDLVYQDVIDFFATEKEESDKIEFKSYHSPSENENDKEKENGVIRTVCALLNSNGGLVIWGAPVGQIVSGRKEKVFVGVLSPVTRLIEKDYFINRITDSITPSPNEVYFFRLEDGRNYVYVIEVGKSEYSPHQFRNVYYMRIDGQSKPAPHHYIEALFKKITHPKLKGYIKPERLYDDGTSIFLEITPVIFNLSKLQNEHNIYYRIVVTKGIFFNSLSTGNPGSPYGMNGHELRVLNALDTIYYNEPYRSAELLRFNSHELGRTNGEFEILMYLGGKDSPLVLSRYKFRINLQNLNPEDINDLIFERNENIYSFEYSDKLGMTEEQRINAILER